MRARTWGTIGLVLCSGRQTWATGRSEGALKGPAVFSFSHTSPKMGEKMGHPALSSALPCAVCPQKVIVRCAGVDIAPRS